MFQISISPEDRQWSIGTDVLIEHPHNLTDPFVLYIKSSLLISKAKRFLTRQHTLLLKASTDTSAKPFTDLRETKEFKEVDALIEAFISKFPKEQSLKWSGDAAEVHVFLAALVPHMFVQYFPF